jgi:hypothetical protein
MSAGEIHSGLPWPDELRQARLTQDLSRAHAIPSFYVRRLLRLANLIEAALGAGPVTS